MKVPQLAGGVRCVSRRSLQCAGAMTKPKTRRQQDPAPLSPASSTPSAMGQEQATGVSQDALLQMLQLFRDECEQRRREDETRRQAEEQRFNQLVATLGTQPSQQAGTTRRR